MNDDIENISYWFDELSQARKRDSDFISDGERIMDIYACRDDKRVPFNILYSNTDTLLPALYSSVPRPVVMRRFRDDDPVGKAASMAATRMLEYLLDTNTDGYETFDEGVKNAVLDALLPGRGITACKYDAVLGEAEYGSEQPQEPLQEKKSELICIDSKKWNRVLFGYCEKWSEMPWIAFEQNIDQVEAVRLFGQEIAAKIKFTRDNVGPDDDDKSASDEDGKQGGRKTAVIYQIWDKSGGKMVRYVSKHYEDGFLKVEADPLELSGFYPIPRPLQFLASSDNQPVAPYAFYKEQAEEINELTKRIKRLAKAIKARGVYDSELGDDIKNLMDGVDNEMIPADKSAALAAQNGFQNAIWFMPIEQMVAVLQQLYAAREQCKQVIYEITGISDIIRGSTVATETATAQNIKSQWGTMRLQRLQREVQRYARDLLRIMLEMAASKFSESTWVQMTGLPYATSEQVMQAQMIMQAAQQQPPQIGPDGQPQMSPIVQQAQQIMQAPQWPQILELLKSDLDRSYRIDIETNSTILPQLQEDQQNMTEAMTALSQYISSIAPLVQAGIFPFEAAKSVMLAVIRRYQFGADLEDAVKSMQQPPPPVDNTLQVEQAKLESQKELSEDKNKTALSSELIRAGAALAATHDPSQVMEIIGGLAAIFMKSEPSEDQQNVS